MRRSMPGRRLPAATAVALIAVACTELDPPPPPGAVPTGTTAAAEYEQAAARIIRFLQGEADLEPGMIEDAVELRLGPESGGGVTTLRGPDRLDRSNWTVRSAAGTAYSLVPPAGHTDLHVQFGTHLNCLERPLEGLFPDLAQQPHVGTRLAPRDASSCLQMWSATFVFGDSAGRPVLSAMVYDQWEW